MKFNIKLIISLETSNIKSEKEVRKANTLIIALNRINYW